MGDIGKIVEDILDIGPARRGELSQHWVKRTGPDGIERKFGPYHVLQWRSGGEKHCLHVKAGDVARIREETRRGKAVAEKLGELEEAVWAAVGEAGTKKRTRSKRPAEDSGKS